LHLSLKVNKLLGRNCKRLEYSSCAFALGIHLLVIPGEATSLNDGITQVYGCHAAYSDMACWLIIVDHRAHWKPVDGNAKVILPGAEDRALAGW
jgi:hypothetical protein